MEALLELHAAKFLNGQMTSIGAEFRYRVANSDDALSKRVDSA